MSSRNSPASAVHRYRHRAPGLAAFGCALLALLAGLPVTAAGPWENEGTLVASDGSGPDFLGWSSAISGDTALVGAWQEEVDGNQAQGAAYVFQRQDGVWTEQAKLTASDGAALDGFGTSVALVNDVAFVAAPCYPPLDGCTTPGAVYVFTRAGGVWSEQAKLTASDGTALDNFGLAIAPSPSADVVFVGAPRAAIDGSPLRGAVYVFRRVDEEWVEQAKLTASDGMEGDLFGSGVALSGDTVLVGAPGPTAGEVPRGSVYVFTRDGEGWIERTRFSAADAEAGDFFGNTVALSGDTAVIGAQFHFADGSPMRAEGAAYVFTGSDDTWTEQAKLVAPDATLGANFGAMVAAEGDAAVVGAPRHQLEPGVANGAVYVFTRGDGEWALEAKLTGAQPTALLGHSVAFEDVTIVAGAPSTSVDGNAGQGIAAVFVRGAGSGTPRIQLAPAELSATLGEGQTTTEVLTVSNLGDGILEWVIQTDKGCNLPTWVAADPTSGTVPGGGDQDVEVLFDATGLPPGVYSAGLCIESNDAERPFVTVPLTLTVTDGAGFAPAALSVDPDPVFADGNGVLEPAEVVEVVPAWRNDGSLETPLTGAASQFVGPEGADYALLLADGDYGLVEPDQTAACLRGPDACYWLGVSAPAGRPATHWEASFDETLSDLAGTSHTWTLHIGDSFTDVPRSSPFYRAIETLLHHGVTGGCADAAYCPAGASTRAQMTVFLLRAAEGADYVPPACVAGEERFDDVPADHPFCPWIQELAHRDVVAGCDGANYCPDDSVTRAQMAVFLLKTREGGAYIPPPCSNVFPDVPCPSTFAPWIEELVRREITSGCGATAYCPSAPVTRQQMAVFLSRTFTLDLYGP